MASSKHGVKLAPVCRINALSYGAFPDIANDFSQQSLLMPGGAVSMAILKNVMPVDFGRSAADTGVCGSRPVPLSDDRGCRHPRRHFADPLGTTWCDVKGSDTHIQQLNEQERYSD